MVLNEGMTTNPNPNRPTSRYYRTTRARSTGVDVTTAHGLELGLDVETEGSWYNVCDTHGFICSHTSLALARAFASAPEEWCAVCRGDEPAAY